MPERGGWIYTGVTPASKTLVKVSSVTQRVPSCSVSHIRATRFWNRALLCSVLWSCSLCLWRASESRQNRWCASRRGSVFTSVCLCVCLYFGDKRKGQGEESTKHCGVGFCTLVSAGLYSYAVVSCTVDVRIKSSDTTLGLTKNLTEVCSCMHLKYVFALAWHVHVYLSVKFWWMMGVVSAAVNHRHVVHRPQRSWADSHRTVIVTATQRIRWLWTNRNWKNKVSP